MGHYQVVRKLLIGISMVATPLSKRLVVASINCPWATSIIKAKLWRKLAPKIGVGVSAKMNIHRKQCLSPKSSDWALSVRLNGCFISCCQWKADVWLRLVFVEGNKLTAAHVSIKNRRLVIASCTSYTACSTTHMARFVEGQSSLGQIACIFTFVVWFCVIAFEALFARVQFVIKRTEWSYEIVRIQINHVLPIFRPNIDDGIEVFFGNDHDFVIVHPTSIFETFDFFKPAFSKRYTHLFVQCPCIICLFPVALSNGFIVWIVFDPRNPRYYGPCRTYFIITPVLYSIVALYCDITHLRTVVQLSLDPVFHRSRVRCI